MTVAPGNTVLTIHRLNKVFKTDQRQVHVLDQLFLDVEEGELVSIIGPSGCGKSTLLKLIAGLDTDYDGSIKVFEEEVQGPSKERGFIFQEHRLFPWSTVEQNIAGNLKLKDPVIREKVDDLIGLVNLRGFEKAYPRQISGGMSQRVAIARALLRNPKILFLDEPFGALDAFTREHLQEELLKVWEKNKTTMLLVTHDIDEAIFLSTRVIVMDASPGRIKAIIKIDLPHLRTRSSKSFLEYRSLIMKHLNHEIDEVEDFVI